MTLFVSKGHDIVMDHHRPVAGGARTVCLGLVALLGSAVFLPSSSSAAAECKDDKPSHPEWVFCHDFEAPDADQYKKYWNVSATPDPKKLFLTDETIGGVAGHRILRIKLENSTDADMEHSLGAGLGKWFGKTVTWEDFYYRKYLRFNKEFYQGKFMHLGRLRACAPSIYPWECLGGAGHRPAGDTKYTTGVEPWIDYGRIEPPGRWGFYSYYHEMYQDCGFPSQNDCYGDMFAPKPYVIATRGVWHVVEFMIHPNSPGKKDGYQKMWIDGKMVYKSPDMSWRTVDSLRVNQASLGVYIHYPPAHTTNIVDYDNVVFSTKYIGPSRCQPAVAIEAPCICGGKADPDDDSHVHNTGYCCSGHWQDKPCSATGDAGVVPDGGDQDAGSEVDPGGSREAGGDTGTGMGQDSGQGGATGWEAGTDAAGGGRTTPSGTEDDESSGCACRAGHGRDDRGWWVVAGMLGIGLARRRRRGSCSGA